MALLEAMSAGLPIIATRLEGLEEVVSEGVHGLFMPVDDANALSHVILQLLRDPPLRARMGAAAKQRVDELYSMDRSGEQYLELMYRLLNRTPESS
jgi:glycosyltransferase involved in cell wall biosynthesis